jgi:hypothetical protein
VMKHAETLRARQKLLSRLPVTGELLRGSLLERIVRHSRGCAKCARGEGHPVSVLTVGYPGGRTRQFSLRREQVAENLVDLLDIVSGRLKYYMDRLKEMPNRMMGDRHGKPVRPA